MKTKHIIWICLLSGISLCTSTQNLVRGDIYTKDIELVTLISRNSVSGRIGDAVTKKPIQFAMVTLVNADSADITYTFQSLYNGYFLFKNVPCGSYSLKVTAPGFIESSIPVFSIFNKDVEIYLGQLLLTETKSEILLSSEQSMLE